jgi:hypothetical protein
LRTTADKKITKMKSVQQRLVVMKPQRTMVSSSSVVVVASTYKRFFGSSRSISSRIDTKTSHNNADNVDSDETVDLDPSVARHSNDNISVRNSSNNHNDSSSTKMKHVQWRFLQNKNKKEQQRLSPSSQTFNVLFAGPHFQAALPAVEDELRRRYNPSNESNNIVNSSSNNNNSVYGGIRLL